MISQRSTEMVGRRQTRRGDPTAGLIALPPETWPLRWEDVGMSPLQILHPLCRSGETCHSLSCAGPFCPTTAFAARVLDAVRSR
jgi:hypothetical protein